jgi:hypothetical protein
MLKGMSLHGKNLDTSLSTSCFSLVLIINGQEGHSLGTDLDTKKGEDVESGIMEGVIKDSVSPTPEKLWFLCFLLLYLQV